MIDATIITTLGIDPSARAETLAIQDFAALANYMSNASRED
jgi:16S rRNA A1518/A1519 N6-dimethyltransferase RsmA/KsgA/DIM1 with predicted DNA glycosylase/AP lyase activity